ncbi:MAG: PQQ-binding-like beta-propeller repeat protein [Candidatus Anstonellaceae archaeon]
MKNIFLSIFFLIFLFGWQTSFAQTDFLTETNNLVVKNDEFEIIYEPQIYTFTYPFDIQLERYVTVKNLRDRQLILNFFTEIEGPNGFKMVANPFPQWQPIYLDPNESENIFVRGEWGELNLESILKNNTEYEYSMKINVFPLYHEEKKLTVTLSNKVFILSDKAVNFPNDINKINPNFWVSGYVFDNITHQPLSNVKVKGWANNFESSVFTDKNGFYRLPLLAHKRITSNEFMEINIITEAPNYLAYNRTIIPKIDENYKLDIYLEKSDISATYILKKKYNTGPLHLHRGDSSKDNNYFALVPFHSVGVSEKDIKENAYLWFFNKAGDLLWKYKLGYQDTTVDVSDDGEYIATAIQSNTPYAVLLNKNGEELWKFFPPENKNPTEVQISHNNKYYAVGCGDGTFYLLDRATGKIIWSNFLEGQIRNIRFEDDDSRMYISEGHGYLYALSIDNNILWRTYVYSWTIDMAVSKNFIFTGAKVGRYVTLLDKKTGKIVWRYPVEMVPDRLLIAPDESFFYIGISSGYSRSIFLDKEGKVLYTLPIAGNAAALSQDGQFIVVSTRIDVPHKEGANKDMGVPLVELINVKNGNSLWSAVMNDDLTNNHPAHSAYAWISDDMREMVIADFQYVYFFEGKLEKAQTEKQSVAKINTKEGAQNLESSNKTLWQKIIDWLLNIIQIFK